MKCNEVFCHPNNVFMVCRMEEEKEEKQRERTGGRGGEGEDEDRGEGGGEQSRVHGQVKRCIFG